MTGNGESPCHIRLLGELEITRDGERLYEQRRRGIKTYTVLAYLLLKRGHAVPAAELASVAGISTAGENVTGALKVLIYRIRKRLSEGAPDDCSCITAAVTSYAWNMGCGIRVDLFEAEALCESVLRAKQLTSLSGSDIEALADLCGHELLTEMRGEAWADVARARYGNLHVSAMAHALLLMWREHDAERIIRICHRGLAHDPKNALLWKHLKRAMREASRQRNAEINASG